MNEQLSDRTKKEHGSNLTISVYDKDEFLILLWHKQKIKIILLSQHYAL